MAEEKRSVMGEVLDNMAARANERRAEQPAFGAEMRAVFRQGREDAFNNLIPAFPQTGLTREQGAPGSPTAQIVTENLKDREVGQDDQLVQEVATKEKNLVTKDEVEQELARMTQGREQSRGR
jgi:hypothetical protein